jgi:hypothetical protein
MGAREMRQFILGMAALGTLAGILTLSRSESAPKNQAAEDKNGIIVEKEKKNPWTNLKIKEGTNEVTLDVTTK